MARHKKESATKTNEKVVYCLCEGKNDKAYLEKIKEFISENNKKYRGSVDDYEIVIHTGIQNTKTFATEYNKYIHKEDFDKLYWFYDVDFDETKHKYSLNVSDIYICKVNPAIEFFLLLHEKNVDEIKKILGTLTGKYQNYNCVGKDDNKSFKKALKTRIDTCKYIKNLTISENLMKEVIDKETKWENGNHKNFYSNYGDFLNKEYLLKLNPKLPGN